MVIKVILEYYLIKAFLGLLQLAFLDLRSIGIIILFFAFSMIYKMLVFPLVFFS